jgi:hypothetical protein
MHSACLQCTCKSNSNKLGVFQFAKPPSSSERKSLIFSLCTSLRLFHCDNVLCTFWISQRCYNKQHVFEDVFDVLLAWEGTAIPMKLLSSWGEEGFVSDTMVSSLMLLLFWSDESIECFLPSCKLLLVISGFCSCWELEWLESASFAESTVKERQFSTIFNFQS